MKIITRNILILLFTAIVTSASAQTATPPNQERMDLEIDALTPSFVQDFQEDYSSFIPDRIMKWISPRRGLVQDGVLMTYDDTKAKMQDAQKEMKDIKTDIRFLRGYYNGISQNRNFYKAFYQLIIKAGKTDQKINIIAIFEKIDGEWSLVQTQNLRLSRGTIQSSTTDALALQSNILTIGDYPFDFEGTTISKTPKRFASRMAQSRKRPVLLNFFTRIAGLFSEQLEWAETLFPKYKGKNIYIFCVSDDKPEYVKSFLEEGGWKISGDGVLLDKDSLIHHDLEIDIHPYIMLLDHNGVVRTISRGYNKESFGLVESITNEIIDEANRAIALEKEGGPPIHKY